METKNTKMAGDRPVERVEIGEHFSSEPDNTHLYISKEVHGLTSMQPRVNLPWVSDGAVRNHAVMVTTTSASTIERQRSLAQLKTMAAAGNEDAVTTLAALEGLMIENDPTVQPYDSSIERVRSGNYPGVTHKK